MPCWLGAQYVKSEHSLGADVMITFKPSNEYITKPSPNNTLLVYVFGKYKGYKNPGVSYYYQWKTPVRNNLKLGLQLACNIRYLQEVVAGEYETFYSFPLRGLIEWKALKGPQREYGLQGMGGYNFKHPRHKLLDGLGGFTAGISATRYHPEHHFGVKLGMDFYQETSFLKFVPDAGLPNMVEETFRFNQQLFQFRFGFYKMLN
jgi:hypothetical protein